MRLLDERTHLGLESRLRRDGTLAEDASGYIEMGTLVHEHLPLPDTLVAAPDALPYERVTTVVRPLLDAREAHACSDQRTAEHDDRETRDRRGRAGTTVERDETRDRDQIGRASCRERV